MPAPDFLPDHHVSVAASELDQLRRDSTRLAASDLERIRLRSGLREAIQLADEGWAYAGEYFRDKWDCESRIAELRKLVSE
jgi:hypothetical protein